MTPQKVLVTGGAGFIGSHIIEALLQKGRQVHVLDDLSTGKRENIPPEVRFFEGNILDSEAVDQAMEGTDAVIHLAARVAIRDSLKNFVDDANANLMGPLQLIHQCGRHKVKKFLYASSMAVYSDSQKADPIPETYTQEPISPYGISKLAAEKYVRLLSEPLGINCICLRYFNVYGVRQSFTPYVGVITIFIDNLLKGQTPVIFGDGNQQRDFVYVGDISRATLLALDSDIDGDTFNVGSGKATSVNQIANLLIEKIKPGLQPIHQAPHPGEIRNSIADISKIQKRLGFQPQGDLQERINEVIAWKQRNASG